MDGNGENQDTVPKSTCIGRYYVERREGELSLIFLYKNLFIKRTRMRKYLIIIK